MLKVNIIAKDKKYAKIQTHNNLKKTVVNETSNYPDFIDRARFWKRFSWNKMAKLQGKVYLGFEEEIVGDKNQTLVNYTVNKIGGFPVSWCD